MDYARAQDRNPSQTRTNGRNKNFIKLFWLRWVGNSFDVLCIVYNGMCILAHSRVAGVESHDLEQSCEASAVLGTVLCVQ